MIDPLIHCICLMWARSKYYPTRERMINLFKMISNMMIVEANKCLDAGTLFQGEADESLAKTSKCIQIIEHFKYETLINFI